MSSDCATVCEVDTRVAPAGSAASPASAAAMSSLRSTTPAQGSRASGWERAPQRPREPCPGVRHKTGRTADMQGLSKRAVPLRGTAWCQTQVAVCERGSSVPDADVAVQRVPLDRGLAEALDQVHELVGARPVRGPGGADDVLLDHHRAEVVGAELE